MSVRMYEYKASDCSRAVCSARYASQPGANVVQSVQCGRPRDLRTIRRSGKTSQLEQRRNNGDTKAFP